MLDTPWLLPPGSHPQIYRQFFTASECKALDDAPLETALSEISLLRILILRLLAASQRKRALSLEGRLSMLTAFSAAGLMIASLARFHDKHFGFAAGYDPGLALLAEIDSLPL